MALKAVETQVLEESAPNHRLKCGVIMPISSIGDYPESHWADVLEIIRDAVADAGLEASLVSYADETTVIPKTIVQNLYDNRVVVCDVSGKNPNVMFELGLRLAFDKPTIIMKDSATSFSFDTGTIEHLPYPRDLRFAKIVEFKAKLTAKITATLQAAKDPDYSTFLKHFGKFTDAKLEEKEVSEQEYVIQELQEIRQLLNALRQQGDRSGGAVTRTLQFPRVDIDVRGRDDLLNAFATHDGVHGVRIQDEGGQARLLIEYSGDPTVQAKLISRYHAAVKRGRSVKLSERGTKNPVLASRVS